MKLSLFAVFAAIVLTAAQNAGATPAKSYWTQAKAEQTVVSKVKIPQCKIWPNGHDCSNGALLPGHPALGVSLVEAHCQGASELRSTFKYGRFTCAFTTINDYAEGHVAVYVTGPATFRWKVL